MGDPGTAMLAPSTWRDRLAEPMTSNGLALLANTGLTGVLGFAYWVLAARLFPAAAVGRAGALVSTVTLCAALGQLNLSGMLMRFLPAAGRYSRRLVLGGYAFAAVAAALLSALVCGVVTWAGGTVVPTGWRAGWVVLATAGTVVFTLEDSVLTGLRRASWVPLENGVFGVLKIGLLVVLASSGTAWALFASWMLPLALVVPLVTVLLFARLLPSARTGPPASGELTRRAVVRFVAGDASAGLFTQAWIYLLPVLVTAELGDVANARFYGAFLLSSTVDLVASNLASALTVEGAHRPHHLPELTRRTVARCLALVAAAVAVLAALAPWVLHWYGAGYAAAAWPFRLLLFASLPKCVLVCYYAVLRVRRRTHLGALFQGVVAVAVVASSTLAARPFGLVGIAAAVLACQVVVAGFAAIGVVRVIRGDQR